MATENYLGQQAATTEASSGCSAGDYFKNLGSSFMNGVSNLGSSIKNKFNSLTGSQYGGFDPIRAKQRMRMQMRMMRGGTARPYHNLTNLASHGAPIYGIRSAAPHQWTRGGGRYRRKKCNKRKTRRCSRRRGRKFTRRMR
jgi:hypothetical protein